MWTRQDKISCLSRLQFDQYRAEAGKNNISKVIVSNMKTKKLFIELSDSIVFF